MIEKGTKRILLGAGILAGGIIGAGVFSLPYAFSKAGLSIGFFYLAVAGVVYTALHLMYGHVLSTLPTGERFVSAVKHYLGQRWGVLAVLMSVCEMICVLTIYLILSKSFLALLFPSILGDRLLLCFWLLGSFTIFLKSKRLALSEFWVTVAMAAIIIGLFVAGLTNVERLGSFASMGRSWTWLIPLPAVLFALSGRVAIPAVLEFVRGKAQTVPRKALFWAISIGTLVPVVVYGLFVLGVLSLSTNVTEDAITGLSGALPLTAMILLGILGGLCLWSSYILVGLDVYKTLEIDLSQKKGMRFFLVIVLPLLLYAGGLSSFLGLISFVGGIFLSLEGLFIIAMYYQSLKPRVRPLVKMPLILTLLLFVALLATLVSVLVS